MSLPGPDELDLEILGFVLDDDESTATVLATLRLHVNRDEVSERAARLTADDLDAVFERLRALGLVTTREEETDGYQLAEPGSSFTWWCVTAAGRRAYDDWDSQQP